MPIFGFSEQHRNDRAGHVRLGIKKKTDKGFEYPSKTDYFVFDPNDKALIPVWNDLFGERANKITVALPSNEIDQVWDLHYRCYGGASGLLCKGNGATATRVMQDGQWLDVRCPGPEECDYSMDRGQKDKKTGEVTPGCKRVGRLQFFIPDMPTTQVFELASSGRNTCLNIQSGLRTFAAMKGGRIAGIPVELQLHPEEVQNPKTGKKVLIYAVHLVIPVSLRQIGALKPLFDGPSLPYCPPPSDDIPTDLYPQSVVGKIGSRVGLRFIESQVAEPCNEAVDQETGEVLEAASPGDEEGDHRLIDEALSQFPPAKQKALRASAEAGNWSREQFLDVIAKQGGGRQASPQTPATPSAPAPPAPPTAQPDPSDVPDLTANLEPEPESAKPEPAAEPKPKRAGARLF